MDILDELIERFAMTLDSELCNNADYLKATALIHDLSSELTAKQANELEDNLGRLTLAVFNAGIRSGLRLGAKIAVGLISSDK